MLFLASSAARAQEPGLVAVYRSLIDRDARLQRIDLKPAFHLGRSSPHPRLPTGPFEVVWTGRLSLTDSAALRFDAFLCGELTLEVDGVVVLQGRGTSETAQLKPGDTLKRPAGSYPIAIRYRSLPDLPARLQLWWEGDTFSREPLPAWLLKHRAEDAPSPLAEQGRLVVERFGCARCHSGAFPGVAAPPPGPDLADVGRRVERAWLLNWLHNPGKVRSDARMPILFGDDRAGFVERWLVADYLLGSSTIAKKEPPGDHRMGRRHFVSSGCATCHFLPDADRAEQPQQFERYPLVGLRERLPADELAAFLGNPHARYPDGRMPRLPLTPDAARDIAAFLLLWSKPLPEAPAEKAPTPAEIQAVTNRLKVRGRELGPALLKEKRCVECHTGLGQSIPSDVALKDNGGCLSGRALPQFTLGDVERKALAAYRGVAASEKHASPFTSRQRLIEHLKCLQCHQRDSDRPPPIEALGSTLGGAWLQPIPFQRTPRLSYPHQKYTRAHLLTAVREGVAGLRHARYSYRMPAFGRDAEAILQGLAEADGELPSAADPGSVKIDDPTLGPLAGATLAGFTGYACVSCHVWAGEQLAGPDPGHVGTDLTRVSGRIRRDWFDRYLENPARAHPGTPMPSIFEKGKPATLRNVLDGDQARQKDALWHYFALGKRAPSPKPPPAMPIDVPRRGEPPLVAQIPVKLPSGENVESLTMLYDGDDVIVYDLGAALPHTAFVGARLLRGVQGRLRTFTVSATTPGTSLLVETPIQLKGDKLESSSRRTLLGYDRTADGVRLRWQLQFSSGKVELTEVVRRDDQRQLVREFQVQSAPVNHVVELSKRSTSVRLPAATTPAALERILLTPSESNDGRLERPGYRAIVYPRPKTVTGEDRVMPGAVAVHPRDGRVFVASMKTGELLVLRDPTDDGKQARFDNYAHGLFQEAFSMLAEDDALYVLHRRNLTRIPHAKEAERFDRVALLPHGIADTYDYGYGLCRDRKGAFVLSYAPYANAHLPGSGSALRLVPGRQPEEIGYGFRNPVGWCSGPEGEVFFTDNQGEWVATNKLCHLVEGGFHGFPNPAQREHAKKPLAKTTVWVPYSWAKSINGVTYDNTRGKFGPFAGQLFMAELMFGGAIVRANVEKVNGVWQGACFPFWGQGLMGPLSLAFDRQGRLWVGSITEPGWMAQPDRGALYRVDFTGKTPFEMQSIHVRPHGFRIVFTTPVFPESARERAAYRIDHHRYEYTGAYGSPELDRTTSKIERVEVAADGRSVELITDALVKDRVYLIQAKGVRSQQGEALVYPTGAYTLNEVPGEKQR